MNRRLTASAIFCSVALAAAEPPKLSTVRYDEDCLYLRDPGARSGAWWEPLKFIPLNASGDVYLTFGNEARLRYEVLRNHNFGEGPQDDDGYMWLRTLPSADLHAGEHFRAFGQLVSAFAVDREPFERRVDENRFDVLQAFTDFRFALLQPEHHLTIRLGRQMLKYGSDRLISNRYGLNVPESFDGLKAFAQFGSWQVDAFWVRPVESDFRVLDDEHDDKRALWSLYLTKHLDAQKKIGLDAYYIGYESNAATFNQGTAPERRHTLGTRIFGISSGWDWNAEGIYQFGTFGDGNIRGWSVGSDTGYTFTKTRLSPRVSVKANIISGDDDPTDPDLQTFNPLFPRGNYFGGMRLLGPYNLINLHPSLALELHKHWSATLSAIFYWRENTGDGIYDNAGNLVRADGSSTERYIGGQAEFLINYHPSRNLEIECAVSHFTPSSFIEETGRSADAIFVSAEIRLTF